MEVPVRCAEVGGRVERHLILKFEFLLLAQSGQSLRRKICPLSDNSGQNPISARDGLSANDPSATSRASYGSPFEPLLC
jgi:hypothetical protein